MEMTYAYGAPSDEAKMIKLIHPAADITLIDVSKIDNALRVIQLSEVFGGHKAG